MHGFRLVPCFPLCDLSSRLATSSLEKGYGQFPLPQIGFCTLFSLHYCLRLLVLFPARRVFILCVPLLLFFLALAVSALFFFLTQNENPVRCCLLSFASLLSSSSSFHRNCFFTASLQSAVQAHTVFAHEGRPLSVGPTYAIY